MGEPGPSNTAETVSITSDVLTARISCLGAELQALVASDGGDLLWDGDPAVWRGRAPILFPVIGALQDGRYRLDGRTFEMPKHGFARNSAFDVVAATASSTELRLTASDATRRIYPFEFQLDIGFALSGCELAITATISNLGSSPLPASFGFHPAFRWPLPFGHGRARHRIRFEADEPAPVRRIDPSGLLMPAGQLTPVIGDTLVLRDELFVNDALIFDRLNSRRVFYGAATGPQIAIAFPYFPMLGLWTRPGAGFICIEPWHGCSDLEGFAGGLRDKPGSFEVAPGASKRLTMQIAVVSEPRLGTLA